MMDNGELGVLKIPVTQEDIDQGVSCTWGDPIALAVKRVLGDRLAYVRSDKAELVIRLKGNRHQLIFKNPPAVYNWIFRFDNDLGNVDPFEYTLDLDSPDQIIVAK